MVRCVRYDTRRLTQTPTGDDNALRGGAQASQSGVRPNVRARRLCCLCFLRATMVVPNFPLAMRASVRPE
eukprot:5512623-Heterocapsa_arctica.AAC.1